MKHLFFKKIDMLDSIITDGPGSCYFRNKIAPLFVYAWAQRYFYDHLTDPEWLKVLKSNGEFKTPPEPQEDKEPHGDDNERSRPSVQGHDLRHPADEQHLL